MPDGDLLVDTGDREHEAPTYTADEAAETSNGTPERTRSAASTLLVRVAGGSSGRCSSPAAW